MIIFRAEVVLVRADVLPGLRRLIIPFEDRLYRDQLRPRFGKGLFLGSDQQPQDGIEEEDEMDQDDPGTNDAEPLNGLGSQ